MGDLYALMSTMYGMISAVSTFFKSTFKEVLTMYLPDSYLLEFINDIIASLFPWLFDVTMLELFFGGGIIMVLVFKILVLIWPFGD